MVYIFEKIKLQILKNWTHFLIPLTLSMWGDFWDKNIVENYKALFFASVSLNISPFLYLGKT